jgi:pimeloyl-ACP methyl ester carboxylesterase
MVKMTLHYQETGDSKAPAIVFIHGAGLSGWMWRQQTAYFDDYHCVVPDLPGHRKSRFEGPFSIADSVNQIADLIEKVTHNKKAHVVGHSLGGKVLIELLAVRPDLLTMPSWQALSADLYHSCLLSEACSRASQRSGC